MGIIKEFREFALKGNVIDLAVAVVIGAAFNKVVSSVVEDVLMPPLGLLIGGIDFTNLKLVLKDGPTPEQVVSLNYGNFLQNVIQFIIVAFAVFMLVKTLNTLRRRLERQEAAAPPPPPPAPTREEVLLAEIRDLLKTRG